MVGRGLQPDVVTFNTLLFGGASAKLPEKAMVNSPHSPLRFIYFLHHSLFHRGFQGLYWGLAIQTRGILGILWLQKKKKNKQFDKFLTLFCASPWLQEIYGRMSALGVTPNAQSFRILLEAVSKAGRLRSSLEVFNEMKALGIPLKTTFFNSLLEACATAPQPDVRLSGGSGGENIPLFF